MRFGVHAGSENAALSPPEVGEAIPAHAVEGRALSGPRTRWCFARKDQLECALEPRLAEARDGT